MNGDFNLSRMDFVNNQYIQIEKLINNKRTNHLDENLGFTRKIQNIFSTTCAQLSSLFSQQSFNSVDENLETKRDIQIILNRTIDQAQRSLLADKISAAPHIANVINKFLFPGSRARQDQKILFTDWTRSLNKSVMRILEKNMEIADPAQKKQALEQWLADYGSYFDDKTIQSLDSYHICTLIDCFSKTELISNNFSQNQIFAKHLAFQKNNSVAHLLDTFEDDYGAIAYHIANQKIPLVQIAEEFGEERLLLLAPHLRHGDFEGMSVDLIDKLLEKSTQLYFLNISNTLVRTLPTHLTELRTLYCTKSSIQSLPEDMIYLETLNCSDSVLTDLPKGMDNLKQLDCKRCKFQTLPEDLTHLEELNCSNSQLKSLPPRMPALKKLYCSWCKLQTLPEDMTQLEKLTCWGSRLTGLPPGMHNLKKLDCKGSKFETWPKDLDHLEKLDCSNSEIKNLPEGMNCLKKLNCSRSKLESLPEGLTHLEELNCQSSLFLEEIPNYLTTLKQIDCSGCTALHRLPEALPLLVRLDCSNCFNLNEMLPSMPESAEVITENIFAFTKFRIDLNEFKQNPKKVLVELGKNFLLKDLPFPNIYYYENGEPNEGIDAGGLRRDVVNRFTETIFGDIQKNPTHLWHVNGVPFLTLKQGEGPQETEDAASKEYSDSQIAYQTLGKILALCYNPHTSFQTGARFKEDVYHALTFMPATPLEEVSDSAFVLLHQKLVSKEMQKPLQVEEMQKFIDAPNVVENLSKETLEFMTGFFWEIDRDDPLEDETSRKQLRDAIVLTAKENGTIYALNLIAMGIKSSLKDKWEAFCAQPPSLILKRIEGVLTKDELVKKIDWMKTPSVTDEAFAKTKQLFKEWLEKADMNLVRQLVRAISSNDALGKDRLKFEVNGEPTDRLPVTHTCFFSVHFPAYESLNQFTEKFAHLLTAEGFQFG